jgi:hypothetical protein
MRVTRADLLSQLEAYYRGCGWKVEPVDDRTVHAHGPGGVIWVGLAVVGDDLREEAFAAQLSELSRRRMDSGGERCPLELLPDPACADELRSLLTRLRLTDQVSVYSLASAA